MLVTRIIIAHYYSPGSAATNRIIAYAKGFTEIGVRVLLVLGSSNKEQKPILPGVDIVSVCSKHTELSRKMAQVIERHYQKSNTAVLVYGTPVFTLYCSKRKYNIFYECTEVPLYGKAGSLAQRLKEKIKITLAKRATGMLVISKALQDYFSKKGIKDICVVNMFVDGDRFKVIPVEGTSGKYIAYCGTISSHKDGVDDLIKAFSIFSRQHEDYHLMLIGRFENKESEAYLKQLVSNFGLTAKVDFVGMVPSSKMPALLCGARMLALARPDNEQAKYGFPTKLGEYLATGKPVVVTDVGEIGLFLKDLYHCRLAQPDNPSDFAHYSEAQEIGKRGKELTEEAFSSKWQCEVALEFMNNTINKNSL